MISAQEPPTAVKIAEAAKLLGINADQVARLIRKGRLGTKQYPGLRPLVLLDDVERLARESICPAVGV